MAILDWPVELLRPSNMEWRLNDNGSIFQSKFNGSTQTVTYPGSMWSCEMTFSDLDDYESRALESIIFQLGISGKIKIPDFGRYGRPPAASGKPKVVGANQTGFSVTTGNWIPNRPVLKRGDYINVGIELKMVLADVISNGSGVAIIPVTPMIRNSPADASEIEVAAPTAIFRLTKDQNGVSRKPAFNNDINVSFTESFYI